MALVEPTVREKIERMYRAEAHLVRKTRESHRSRIADPDSGEVLVFALRGHPSARFCYAWESDGRVSTALEER